MIPLKFISGPAAPRALPEDSTPCAQPFAGYVSPYALTNKPLRFEGGPVDTSTMPESHPGGVTPTTVAEPTPTRSYLVDHTLKDLDGALLEARRLVELGRHDEARYELSQVVALAREAIGWLT